MKNLIKIFMFLICLVSSGAIALSTSPTCEECREMDEQIGYKFCDPETNTIVDLCTDRDPYNLPAPYTGWKPMKICLPANIIYDDTDAPSGDRADHGPWYEEIYIEDYEGGYEYHNSDMTSLCNAALGFWENICSPYNNSDCQPCNIRVTWTRDKAKLGVYKNHPSVIYTPVIDEGCKYDCSKLSIILNNTSYFSKVSNTNEKDRPSNYFFTRGNESRGYGKRMYNVDMRLEIIHQIGQILGFSKTTPSGDPGCGTFLSVMSAPHTYDDGSVAYNTHVKNMQGNRRSVVEDDGFQPPYNFTPDDREYIKYDRCTFKLLYCCEPPTDVEDNLGDFNFEILPNPSDTYIIINISLSKPGVVNLGIYDLVGNELINVVDNENKTQKSYQFNVDINSLPSGTYLCIYKDSNKTISKLISIIK
jgi:type IX secretion system substrate protein